jgi:hypothetical protein
MLQGIEMAGLDKNRDRALTAVGDELAALFHHTDAEVLLALLDNPALEEIQLCMLLERKNLPSEILEEVARRKPLLRVTESRRRWRFIRGRRGWSRCGCCAICI